MLVKNIIDEDFVNYKKPAMFIGFPKCSFKCEKECGLPVCQNSALATTPDIEIDKWDVVARFLNNQITQAIVCGGLEPFDSATDVLALLLAVRCDERLLRIKRSDFVIYTGYTEEELWRLYPDAMSELHHDGAVIIKYGRYIPGQNPHFDETLGVSLSSDNQYAAIC